MRRTALLLVLVGCTGLTMRDNALMPTMSLLWRTALAQDVALGLDTAEFNQEILPSQADIWRAHSSEMQRVLNTGDRSQVIGVDWASLKGFALQGIQVRLDRGEIGPGGAATFIETVNVFDQDWQILLSRTP